MTGLLAIIPAYNEEASIAAVLKSIRLHGGDPDVLVVDDGSSDRTADIARRHGATVASLPFNLGVGAALRVGFRYARWEGYQRAIQVDADGQHDPREFPKLIDRLDDGVDLVIGTRFEGDDNGEYQVAGVRGVAMWVMRLIVRTLLGTKFSDTSSGFRAFSPRMLTFFAERYPREYMSDTVEALVTAAYRGYRVEEVSVRMHPRSGGVPSNRSIRLVLHYLRLVAVLVVKASVQGRYRRSVGERS